jgi:hypothetical protein
MAQHLANVAPKKDKPGRRGSQVVGAPSEEKSDQYYTRDLTRRAAAPKSRPNF